jgi:type IV pilus biogenesis protein PilP
VLAACAAGCLPAAASTADDLARIEAEHVVAKARLRLVETQAQIAARQADIERQAPLVHSGMPTVAGIEGMAGRLAATLYLENGFVAEVKAGDALGNGMRVVSIAPGGVVVQTADRRRVRLRPAAEPPLASVPYGARATAAGMALPSTMQPLPSMPPMQSAQPAAPVALPVPAAPGAAR